MIELVPPARRLYPRRTVRDGVSPTPTAPARSFRLLQDAHKVGRRSITSRIIRATAAVRSRPQCLRICRDREADGTPRPASPRWDMAGLNGPVLDIDQAAIHDGQGVSRDRSYRRQTTGCHPGDLMGGNRSLGYDTLTRQAPQVTALVAANTCFRSDAESHGVGNSSLALASRVVEEPVLGLPAVGRRDNSDAQRSHSRVPGLGITRGRNWGFFGRPKTWTHHLGDRQNCQDGSAKCTTPPRRHC